MRFSQLGTLLYANARVRAPLLVSLALTGISTTATVLYVSISQPVLPIFYTYTRPEQALVEKWWLLVLPLCSFLFSLLCHMLQFTIQTIDRFVFQLFAWFTVFVQVVLLLALLRIIVLTA